MENFTNPSNATGNGPLSPSALRGRLRDVAEADLVAGSADPDGARARADRVMRFYHWDDRGWKTPARDALSACLHAAALGGKTLADLQHWINAAPESADIRDEIQVILSDSPEAHAMQVDLMRWRFNHPRTIATIAAVMRSCLVLWQEAAPDEHFSDGEDQ